MGQAILASNIDRKNYTVLYDNDDGNSGTVTLSDSADNYGILDIIIWDFYVTRVFNNSTNRPVGLMKIGGYGGNYFEWYSESVTINGTSITRNSVTHGIMQADGSTVIDTTTHIPIRSVIGYYHK